MRALNPGTEWLQGYRAAIDDWEAERVRAETQPGTAGTAKPRRAGPEWDEGYAAARGDAEFSWRYRSAELAVDIVLVLRGDADELASGFRRKRLRDALRAASKVDAGIKNSETRPSDRDKGLRPSQIALGREATTMPSPGTTKKTTATGNRPQNRAATTGRTGTARSRGRAGAAGIRSSKSIVTRAASKDIAPITITPGQVTGLNKRDTLGLITAMVPLLGPVWRQAFNHGLVTEAEYGDLNTASSDISGLSLSLTGRQAANVGGRPPAAATQVRRRAGRRTAAKAATPATTAGDGGTAGAAGAAGVSNMPSAPERAARKRGTAGTAGPKRVRQSRKAAQAGAGNGTEQQLPAAATG